MTALGGALGFAIGFLTIAVGLSAIACAVVAALGPTLARRGPAVERRAIELAAIAPVAIAALVIVVLIAHAARSTDHCPDHGHHAHLCLAHGAVWLERSWAIALAGAAAVVALGRVVVLATTLVRGRGRIGALARVSRRVDDVQLVESPRVFCFVAGLRRPAIYASTAAWRGLADDERAAMLAHERGHVRGRDVARRTLLELTTVLAAPLAPTFLASRWEHATERLRDADAARATSPDSVARALVAMYRLGAVRVAGASFPTGGSALAVRVEAVLAEGPIGERTDRRLVHAALAIGVALAVAVALSARPLHHALETLLG